MISIKHYNLQQQILKSCLLCLEQKYINVILQGAMFWFAGMPALKSFTLGWNTVQCANLYYKI